MSDENRRGPSGIEVEENHIYFYTTVSDKEALELVRILRRLDIEMGYLAARIGLKKNPPIHLHIQSAGGDVFSGLNICDAIDSCKTDVYTYVEGSAASAATLIAARGKKRFISKRSFMLIHQPQILWAGKHDEFIDEIENQKNIFQTIKKVYLDTTKIEDDDLEELLKHELWLPAEKCLELGLVDSVV
tara:strand:+ start:7586 stop:8149 length:564 start_codon:yes stop_codon:yes gene_type:complete